MKIPESDERFLDAFSILAEQQDVNQKVEKALEEFTCRIYDKKTSISINVARYEVFQKKKAFPDPQMLSPSQDALKMHIA